MSTPGAGSTAHVLIVDDDREIRDLLARFLTKHGYRVTTAQDGQDALEFLSMHAKPDAVLLDMMMPRIDGPAFVRAVRANPKLRGLSIFAISGSERRSSPMQPGRTTMSGGSESLLPQLSMGW